MLVGRDVLVVAVAVAAACVVVVVVVVVAAVFPCVGVVVVVAVIFSRCPISLVTFCVGCFVFVARAPELRSMPSCRTAWWVLQPRRIVGFCL